MSAALARRRKQKAKAAAAAATGGTETLEARVKTLLSTNDTAAHYEALQLLTSNTHRALKAGDVDKAVSTAYTGTCLLLEAGQVEVGSQMSGTFVETLKDGRVDEEGNVEKVKKISELYKVRCGRGRGRKRRTPNKSNQTLPTLSPARRPGIPRRTPTTPPSLHRPSPGPPRSARRRTATWTCTTT